MSHNEKGLFKPQFTPLFLKTTRTTNLHMCISKTRINTQHQGALSAFLLTGHFLVT